MAELHRSMVIGKTALCPFNEDTPALFERWFADQDLVELMGDWEFQPLPYYKQTPQEFVQRIRPTTWLVCALDGDETLPIGYAGITVQNRHRVGIVRIAIAEKEHRRHGYGREAGKLLNLWAFRSLDLFKLQASAAATNRASIELMLSFGYRECGRYTLARHTRDGRSDEVLMELMRDVWEQRETQQ